MRSTFRVLRSIKATAPLTPAAAMRAPSREIPSATIAAGKASVAPSRFPDRDRK
jgi:hypothetical protein